MRILNRLDRPKGVEQDVGLRRLGNFLILHGWQNHQPEGHWQRWLAETLADRGHTVGYPQLPDPDKPVLADWVSSIEANLAAMPTAGRTVICHSLSCIAWLHLAGQESIHLPVDRVIFVAPPSVDFLIGESVLASFLPIPEPRRAKSASVAAPRLVCSDNDPYCGASHHNAYEGAFEIERLEGEGHFDMISGYGDWPGIRSWCEDPTAPIDRREN
jgi:hypothetical protein